MSREMSQASPGFLRDAVYKLWRKFTSAFSTSEFQTGQFWIDGKPIYRKVVSFGALTNGSQKTVAHGITGESLVLALHGVAYDSATGNAIALGGSSKVTVLEIIGDNIAITSVGDQTAYEATYVTVDYVK